jgi:hypothetical protein
MYPRIAIPSTRFEQQNGPFSVLGKAMGKDATGRAGSHYNVIVYDVLHS